jgi:hypothetical protein
VTTGARSLIPKVSFAAIAQLVRASACHAEGCRFKSGWPRNVQKYRKTVHKGGLSGSRECYHFSMTWLAHVFAGLSLFVGSIFGMSPPVTTVQPVPDAPAGISNTSEQHIDTSVHAASNIPNARATTKATSSDTTTWKYFTYVAVPEHNNETSRISRYYTDGRIVYYASTSIPQSLPSPTSFKAISQDYGTDGHAVYYRDRKVSDADPATFYVMAGCGQLGHDSHHTYIQDSINPHNPDPKPDPDISTKAGKTFESIGDC